MGGAFTTGLFTDHHLFMDHLLWIICYDHLCITYRGVGAYNACGFVGARVVGATGFVDSGLMAFWFGSFVVPTVHRATAGMKSRVAT